jgi:hypothetical protein
MQNIFKPLRFRWIGITVVGYQAGRITWPGTLVLSVWHLVEQGCVQVEFWWKDAFEARSLYSQHIAIASGIDGTRPYCRQLSTSNHKK